MNVSQMLKTVCISFFALSFAACASQTAQMEQPTEMQTAQTGVSKAKVDEMHQDLHDREVDLAKSEAALQEYKSKLARQEALLEEQRAKMASMSQQPMSTPVMASDDSLLPPGAKVGECYARILIPNTYETVTETVLKKQASERIEIIPAVIENVTEQVLVEEASQRLEVIPAKYEMVEEKILAKPAYSKLAEVPAVYETVSEKILVRAAHSEWKKGRGPIQKVDQATGEIMCLIEEPDLFKTVTKRVLVSPATTKEITVPAVYTTEKRRVMSQPPTTRIVEIPAKYKTITIAKVVKPAEERRIAIPAEYQTVTKRVKTSDGHMEWRSILCQTNMTKTKISDIQAALKDKGFDPGPIDGVIGSATMKAVNNFQKDKGLVVSKYLTMNTLKALGVN